MTPPDAIPSLYLTYFLAFMGLTLDLKFKKIPYFFSWMFISMGITYALIKGGWNSHHHSLVNFLSGNSPLCLYQVSINLISICLIFGFATWKHALGLNDFYFILALGSLNRLGPFLNILIFTAFAGFFFSLIFLIKKGLVREAAKAAFNTLTLKGRLRNSDGTLSPIHELSIPYSPSIALGILISAGGWGWS